MADAPALLVPPKEYVAQGDILSGYAVPRITGVIDDDLTEYACLIAHSCQLDVDYTPVATAWTQATFSRLFDPNQLSNVMAGKVLQFFPIADETSSLALIVDLHHLSTWSMARIRSLKRIASMDADGVERLQAAILRDFALREVTREKRLPEFEGRTIQRIRSVPEGGDQARVTITVDNEDAFQLWLHPRKK